MAEETNMFDIYENNDDQGKTLGETLTDMADGADIMSENVSFGDAIHASVTAAPEAVGDIAYNIGAKASDTKYNKIAIQNGTKTLLGEDASDMFWNPEVVNRTASDGSIYSEITTSEKYDTDLMMLLGGQSDVDYQTMDDDKKMAYEMLMYTKKYAAMTPGEVNPDNLAEYQTKMNQYKELCDSRDDLNWESVVGLVSTELQQESMTYSEESSDVLDGAKNEDNRLIATTSHNFLLEATKDSYKDVEHIRVAANEDFSYADTLDMDDKKIDLKWGPATTAFSMLSNLGHKIKDWFVSVKESFSSDINLSQTAEELVENIDLQQKLERTADEKGIDLDQALIDEAQSELRYNQAVDTLGEGASGVTQTQASISNEYQ